LIYFGGSCKEALSMIDEKKIIKAIDPLPFPLRSIICSEVKRRYAEVKASERE